MANEKENLQIKKMPQELNDDELNAVAGGSRFFLSANDSSQGTGSCGSCK